MTDWLPRDPDVNALIEQARAYEERMREGRSWAHHLADMSASAFYEQMRVPNPIARREPTPEALLPAWLRRPVNAQVDTWQG